MKTNIRHSLALLLVIILMLFSDSIVAAGEGVSPALSEDCQDWLDLADDLMTLVDEGYALAIDPYSDLAKEENIKTIMRLITYRSILEQSFSSLQDCPNEFAVANVFFTYTMSAINDILVIRVFMNLSENPAAAETFADIMEQLNLPQNYQKRYDVLVSLMNKIAVAYP